MVGVHWISTEFQPADPPSRLDAVANASPYVLCDWRMSNGTMCVPVCLSRISWESSGCEGIRWRGTEGDFDPVLLLV